MTLFRKGSSLCSFTAKIIYHECPQNVLHHKAHTNILAGQGAWEPEKPDPDPVIPTATAGHTACVHTFLNIRTAWHASDYSASIHGHTKVTEEGTPVLTYSHLLHMLFIKLLPYILLKFLEGDSEAKPSCTTAAGCLLATTSSTYTTTSVMRIPQYLANNNPCSLNRITP